MKTVKRLTSLFLLLYLILLVRLIIFKYPDAMTEDILRAWSLEYVLRQVATVNIIPFRTIWDSLFDPTVPVQLPTLIYNIAAFVPLGFLVPIITDRPRKLMIVLLVAVIVSLSIEVVQVCTRLGEGDIDDIILNVFGAAIGYVFFCIRCVGEELLVRCKPSKNLRHF